MSQISSLPAGNAATFGFGLFVEFDCERTDEPVPPFILPPEISADAVRLAGRLASHHLPEDQRLLVRLMLEGKTKAEIATILGVDFTQLYYLWRQAYRATKDALSSLPELEPDLRYWTLARITHFERR